VFFLVIVLLGTTFFFHGGSRDTRVGQVVLGLVQTEALLFLLRILNISNLPDTSFAENRHHSVDMPFCDINFLRPCLTRQNGIFYKLIISRF